MQNPRLASRYAKALIDLAQELNQLEAVNTDMLYLHQVLKSSTDLVNLLKSPIIKADKKQKILAAVFEGRLSNTTFAFINLLVSKSRESALYEMTAEFTRQYMVLKNISKVKVTTAVPLDAATLEAIRQKVASQSTQEIVLESAVDPELIGGFVLETNGQLIDASVLRDLKDIKQQFSKNIYVSDLR
ncbi:F0F1 ATP synthase subunit delta [Chitinophaga silvatica]|uniref:ATP synthase subunit delta n=1 Tax=Chitinophaga silvatica TaxID=2282649 RepID=A0A3E1YC56_9BACT|nr:ATP synthase F1 subunit delta [Chitinophaga silvatica]RFS23820.1 F0F1 ATP synthase subunit delta [Chitinophaga silvatica]